MKGLLLVPTIEETEWVQAVFPGLSPALLPICGKRFIDYAIEQAWLWNFDVVEVLDWHYSEALAKELSVVERNILPVFYEKGEGPLPKTLDDLKRLSTPLTENINRDISVVWGLQLDRRRARSLSEWHNSNLDMLAANLGNPEAVFTIPGYFQKEGLSLGRDVKLGKGFQYDAPALLMNEVRCEHNVHIQGPCIVGNGSYISEGTHLERTVICDNTYIGPNLTLTDKIVRGNRVIDTVTGAWIDIEEPGMARKVVPQFAWLDKILKLLGGTPTLWRA